MPAWATAAMLDYVFTDDRRAVWDNNGGRDFHTLLKEYASGEFAGRMHIVLLCFQWTEGRMPKGPRLPHPAQGVRLRWACLPVICVLLCCCSQLSAASVLRVECSYELILQNAAATKRTRQTRLAARLPALCFAAGDKLVFEPSNATRPGLSSTLPHL